MKNPHLIRRAVDHVGRNRYRYVSVALLLLLCKWLVVTFGEWGAGRLECNTCQLPAEALPEVGPLRIALITDAMRASGQDVTESYLGSADCPQPVIIEDGVAKLLDRQAFGGSIATADRLVRTMVQAGTSLPVAVQMMTQTPVSFLCPNLKKGSVAVGYDADLVLFDDNINMQSIYLNGEKVK